MLQVVAVYDWGHSTIAAALIKQGQSDDTLLWLTNSLFFPSCHCGALDDLNEDERTRKGLLIKVCVDS